MEWRVCRLALGMSSCYAHVTVTKIATTPRFDVKDLRRAVNSTCKAPNWEWPLRTLSERAPLGWTHSLDCATLPSRPGAF